MSSRLNLAPEDYRTILESLPIAVYAVDPERRIAFWNDGCERITGYLRHEVIGRVCADDLLMHCDQSCRILCGAGCPLADTMRDGRPREADVFLRHKAGYRVPVRVRAVPIRDSHDVIVGACECFDERTVVLPGLGGVQRTLPSGQPDQPGETSQAVLLRRLESDLRCVAETQIPFGLLQIGIDHLDQLRAKGGSKAVEAVMDATAQTLARSVGPGNEVARWADGQFIVVLRGCSKSALMECANILLAIGGMEAVPWWGTRLTVNLSAGGSLAYPGEAPADLIQRAGEALLKVEGKNRVEVV